MTIKNIPNEGRDWLCPGCKHCWHNVEGCQCFLDNQHIWRDENTGMLQCDEKEAQEDNV